MWLSFCSWLWAEVMCAMSFPWKEIASLPFCLHLSHGLDYGYIVGKPALIRVDVIIRTWWGNKIATRNVNSWMTSRRVAARPLDCLPPPGLFMRNKHLSFSVAEFWGMSIIEMAYPQTNISIFKTAWLMIFGNVGTWTQLFWFPRPWFFTLGK